MATPHHIEIIRASIKVHILNILTYLVLCLGKSNRTKKTKFLIYTPDIAVIFHDGVWECFISGQYCNIFEITTAESSKELIEEFALKMWKFVEEKEIYNLK